MTEHNGGASTGTGADVDARGTGDGDEGPVSLFSEQGHELIDAELMTAVEEIREAWLKAKKDFLDLGRVFAEQELTSKGLKGVIEEYNQQYPQDCIDYTLASRLSNLYSKMSLLNLRRRKSLLEKFNQTLLLECSDGADQEEFEFRLMLAEKNKWTEKEARKYKRKQRNKDRIQKLETPDGLFDIIVIDPPWEHDGEYDPNSLREAPQYRTLSIEELRELEIPSAENCVLWLWTINNRIHDAYHLLESWDFEAKTVLTWVKDRMGTGKWLRGKSEHCILAIKGNPIWTNTTQSTIIEGPMREHSRKPDEFYDMVDNICYGKKLDMFSREQRDGWDQWGDECDKF